MRGRALVVAIIVALAMQLPGLGLAAARGNPPEKAAHSAAKRAEAAAVHVKFHDGSGVRLRGGELVSTTGADMTSTKEALATHNVVAIRRLFSLPEAKISADVQRAENRSGRKLADLNSYFRLRVPGADAAPLIAALTAIELVDTAYVAPHASPPPSFTHLQGYRNAAPVGIDTSVTTGVSGGTGANVKVIDVEYGWDQSHEDLTKARGAFIANGTPRNLWGDDHGTAVLGELVATPNNFGVTGLVPDAALGLVNADTTDGYMLANAIMIAADALVPGDVLVVEQQFCDAFVANCVPSEWVRETYDAIRFATSAGIIVVEAAGNGGVDLDQFGAQPFPRGLPDSGAIIVGAGEAPDCAASGGPARSRASFSSYGQRVNLQGWGRCVVTTGVGDLIDPITGGPYTASFNGTSSATPIVAAAAASLSSAIEAKTGAAPSPAHVRKTLSDTGTPQDTASPGARGGHIGPMPNLAAAYLASGLNMAAPTNLLVNAGFEDDANADTRPDAWSSNAKFSRSNAVAPRAGSFSGRFLASDNTSSTINQQVGVVPGASYSVSGWVNAPTSADAFTFDIRMQWRTGSGTVISTQTVKRISDDTGGAWQQLTGTVTAPASAATGRILLAAGSLNGAIYVDEMSLARSSALAPTASFIASQSSGTLAVRFEDASTGGPSSWEWNFGDSVSSTEQHPTHTYAVAGSYSVTLTVRNGGGSSTMTKPVTVAPVSAATNLLLNAGFEQDGNGDGRPDSWTANGSFSRSTTTPHSGTYSGRWQSTSNNAPSSYQQVGVSPGTSYAFSGWVRAPTSSDAFTFTIKVLWRGPSGAISTQVVKKLSDDTAGAWQQVIGAARAPSGATLARVQMIGGSLNATIFVDDFSFSATGG